jgi:hypothetical protein
MTWLRDEQSGVRLQAEARGFCLRNFTHPSSYALGTGLKRLGREVNHSPPSGDELNNQWNCTSAHPVCIRGVDRETFAVVLFHHIINY